MDEQDRINPGLRQLNERARTFWEQRMSTERKLLDNPETAQYVLENLRAEAMRHAYDMQVKRDLAKIYRGSDKRRDQQDKADFIVWMRQHKLEVDSIASLRTLPGFVWEKYKAKTLRCWYREAMPKSTLRVGRPRRK